MSVLWGWGEIVVLFQLSRDRQIQVDKKVGAKAMTGQSGSKEG